MEINELKNAIKHKLEDSGFTDIFLEQKGKFKKHTFLLAVSFPNTLRVLYFYKHKTLNDVLVLEFVRSIREITIYFDELQQFIDEMLKPSKGLEHIGAETWNSWAKHSVDERTSTCLRIDNPRSKNFKYFLGLYSDDS